MKSTQFLKYYFNNVVIVVIVSNNRTFFHRILVLYFILFSYTCIISVAIVIFMRTYITIHCFQLFCIYGSLLRTGLETPEVNATITILVIGLII